ncbi:MAG: alpha/beta fold hydrolase [Pleurocapsa sp.]
MYISWHHWLFVFTAIFHLIASLRENKILPPLGKLFDINGKKVHLYIKGEGKATVILDHSLGGIEGYFLIDEIAKITRVCIYDRPGYGWSQSSNKSRCSEVIVQELNLLLTKAKIEPPYILVGDSFGSYNMRLYAHKFPDKVKGIILTDGLHEAGMLNMPVMVKAVKYLFTSGFIMSIFGSLLGLIRLMGTIGLFELIKPELKQFDFKQRQRVKRSFYNHNHWLTMARELIDLNKSGRQLKAADNLGDLPIISIKSKSFFKPSVLMILLPLKTINKLRNKIHCNLGLLSKNYTEIPANNSSHFVWIDEPEIIIQAIKKIALSHDKLL